LTFYGNGYSESAENEKISILNKENISLGTDPGKEITKLVIVMNSQAGYTPAAKVLHYFW